MATLSAVEDLSSTVTPARNAATINSSRNDHTDPSTTHAHVLVKALENFIVPFIQEFTLPLSTGINQDIEDVNHPNLSPEAQDLLDALRNFITSIIGPQQTQHGTLERNIGAEVSEERGNIIMQPTANVNSSTVVASNNPDVSETDAGDSRKQLLKAVLERAHYHVFNRMPIRLLAFTSDGSGMELMERGEILDRLYVSLQLNIEELEEIEGSVKVGKAAVGRFVANHANYAILSHTWLHDTPGEVTYANWKAKELDKTSLGYRKLVNFCEVAAVDHGVTLGWMDTICINKESSAELDESIRSMFKWYHNASVCVTYLAQTTTLGDMHSDPWFTRGWTLQELLAPRYTKFYDTNWQKIADDLEFDAANNLIQQEIQAATTITQRELISFQESHHRLRISRRMQWAANRRVTREEDIAYSLMGIFDVSISIAYGEGSERAFFRLANEILGSARTDVLDIVNWCVGPGLELDISPSTYPSSLIPSSPKQYLWRSGRDVVWFPLTAPMALTPLGLRLSVLLMPAIAANPNVEFHPIGNYSATVHIDAEDPVNGRRLSCDYNLLDRKIHIVPENWTTPTSSILLFGVLNFAETDTSITLPFPSPCLAVCLHSHTNSPVELIETSNIRKVHTSSVIVFDLQRSHPNIDFKIEKESLGRHGMMLYTLHL